MLGSAGEKKPSMRFSHEPMADERNEARQFVLRHTKLASVFAVAARAAATTKPGRYGPSCAKSCSTKALPAATRCGGILTVIGKIVCLLLALFVGKAHAALFAERRIGQYIIKAFSARSN
jgi:hypothetical protein